MRLSVLLDWAGHSCARERASWLRDLFRRAPVPALAEKYRRRRRPGQGRFHGISRLSWWKRILLGVGIAPSVRWSWAPLPEIETVSFCLPVPRARCCKSLAAAQSSGAAARRAAWGKSHTIAPAPVAWAGTDPLARGEDIQPDDCLGGAPAFWASILGRTERRLDILESPHQSGSGRARLQKISALHHSLSRLLSGIKRPN